MADSDIILRALASCPEARDKLASLIAEEAMKIQAKKERWAVIVGNIGTVYDDTTDDDSEAVSVFRDYVGKSKTGDGRCGSEPVTLFRDEEIVSDYTPEKEGCDPDLIAVTAMRKNAQLPTFFLDRSVQGIINERQAMEIAQDVLGDVGPDQIDLAFL